MRVALHAEGDNEFLLAPSSKNARVAQINHDDEILRAFRVTGKFRA
jgi:hypothetical protein